MWIEIPSSTDLSSCGSGQVYETSKYHVPPAATTAFLSELLTLLAVGHKLVPKVCTVIDRGSASCEFIRSTVNQARHCVGSVCFCACVFRTWHGKAWQSSVFERCQRILRLPTQPTCPWQWGSHTMWYLPACFSYEAICQPFAELTTLEVGLRKRCRSSLAFAPGAHPLCRSW